MEQQKIQFKILFAGKIQGPLKTVNNYLEKLQITPVYAESGVDIPAIYNQESPDIVFIDKITGDIETLRMIRMISKKNTCGKDAIIVLVTDTNSTGNSEPDIGSNIDYIIQLPINEPSFTFQYITILKHIRLRNTLNDLNCKLVYANQLLKKLEENSSGSN